MTEITELANSLDSLGPTALMVLAFGLLVFTVVQFLKFLAQEREHRETMAKECHDHHERDGEQTRAVVKENTGALATVAVHLDQCAKNTAILDATLRRNTG